MILIDKEETLKILKPFVEHADYNVTASMRDSKLINGYLTAGDWRRLKNHYNKLKKTKLMGKK
jgi:hypothetical protein